MVVLARLNSFLKIVLLLPLVIRWLRGAHVYSQKLAAYWRSRHLQVILDFLLTPERESLETGQALSQY